jgi:UDP-glucose:(glucosyl)LPS alpha-1,2-glucosyltransferase
MAFSKETGVNLDGKGGTELMAERLEKVINPSLLSKFQIIHSRFADVDLDPKKKKILVVHDLPTDPMYDKLQDGGWDQFDKIVFVSYWQQQMFNAYRGVPYSKGTVIRNAIEPVESHEKPTDKIRLIYFSTPHRGLDIVYAVFAQLAKEYKEIELNVYSSFKLYGWPDNDKPFRELFDKLRGHPQINYYSSVTNEEIREALKQNHILAYPSTWQETSCLVLIEAMSAGLMCVHSSLAALPETSFGMTAMYDYTEDRQAHAQRFYNEMKSAIEMYKNKNLRKQMESRLANDKVIADHHHNLYARGLEWNNLLKRLLTEAE